MSREGKDDFLAKLKKITDNNSSVTLIVTAIILVTFITFILIVYNFLSKSSTNCKNIDKAYKDIYEIDGDNVKDPDKILNESQGNRFIDISFSFNLYVKNNLKLFGLKHGNVETANFEDVVSTETTPLDKDADINYTLLTSLVVKKKLDDLSGTLFFDNDNFPILERFEEYFNNTDIIKKDSAGNIYYKLTCNKSYLEFDITTNSGNDIAGTNKDNDNAKYIPPVFMEDYYCYYVYHTDEKPNGKISEADNVSILARSIVPPHHIYISEKFVKMQQNSLKYTYSTKPDNIANVVLSRDIELLNSRSNIEKVLNKIHNNFILTAFNCCNSGEYQNNYVDTCILKKCLHLGVRCLDFQIFNYNQKPIIASSTMDSLYIKETFNYLELEPVLDIITKHINKSENYNPSPLFLHFRVMSLSEKIYKQLIRSILQKFGKDQEQGNDSIKLVSGYDNLNNISLGDLNKKIVVFINPYYTANNHMINQLDNYINEERNNLNTDTEGIKNYNIYKSGNILTSSFADLILFKNDNYDIYRDSHNKSKPTLVIPELNTKNNDENFVKYMKNNITFISMKFQEVDNFLQVAIHIFSKYKNNTGFLLKNSIDSSIFEINIQPDSVNINQDNAGLVLL